MSAKERARPACISEVVSSSTWASRRGVHPLQFVRPLTGGRALRRVKVDRSSWVEQSPPTYVLASGIVVFAIDDLLRQLSNAA